MTRGKHSSNKAARDARTNLEKENATLERLLARTINERETLEQESSAEIARLLSKVVELEKDVAAGSSDALRAAIDEVTVLEQKLATLPAEINDRLKPLFAEAFFVPGGWDRVAEAIGVPIPDVLGIGSTGNRNARRMTPKKSRTLESEYQRVRANGLDLGPKGRKEMPQ